MNKTIQLITKKEGCCGCYACYNVCTQEAIRMEEDDEGFEYPMIDETKCINCKLCISVCPIKYIESLDNLN
ncbi:MAG: 4Fe-4S dicluster domain-containing protein [Lachnospiraceae bacterium]|nr:4Fe-4S dicluster domain-containing protein [Lachnospiraceae bacterium]